MVGFPSNHTKRLYTAMVMLVVLTAAIPSLAVEQAFAQGTVFQPSDMTPANNPCPKNVVPDDVYNDFKKLLGDLLGNKAGVISDIDNQIKGKIPDNKEKPVTVEIFVVTLDEFKNEYADDVDELFPDKTKDQLKAEAEGIFNGNAAFTYITDKLSANGVQKIKVKVFCKDSFRTATIDKLPMFELLIHELVHAKLYSMSVLDPTAAQPFNDHDNAFFNEIKRLLDLLKKNLELSFVPPPTGPLALIENGFPSDGVVFMGQAVTATFQPDSGLVQEVTFRWINPLSQIAREVTMPLELAEDTFIPNMPGTWILEAESLHADIVLTSFHVPFFALPESPIGALAIIGSSLGAFGAFVALRRGKAEFRIRS